jgi:hypothetical protein
MADLKYTSNGTDFTTYQLNPYLKNRLKYHAASRLASQTGEGLAQAMNVDGHTVTTAKVWAAPASAFPNNADKNNVDAIDATNDLVTVFKTAKKLADGTMSVVESKDFWATDKAGNKNGKVWTNTAYPAVKLYENVPMTAVKGSDGGGKFQSFEILAAEDGYSEGTLRVSDWIAPTAVADQTTGKVVAGFSGIPMYNGAALTKDTGRWAATLGTWEFVYIAGMLTFEPGYTPENKSTSAVDGTTRKSVITLTAFKYDGDYLSDKLDTYDSALSGYTTPLAMSSEFKAIRGLITDVQSEALGIEAGSSINLTTNDESSNTIINLDIADNDKILSHASSGLSATISLVKLGTAEDGYAASYQLQGINGSPLGSTINIPKDQFLKKAEIVEGTLSGELFTPKAEMAEANKAEKYIHFIFETKKKDETGAITSVDHNVYLNIHELVDVYTAGNGIEISTDNSISVDRSKETYSEDFFFVNATGVGVSGVQAAIDLAANSIISSVNEIPDTVTGFKYNTLIYTETGETAIVAVKNDGTNEIIDISEENVNEITESTISSAITTVAAVTGYVKETTSNILPDAKSYADNNFLKEVEVSGAEALSITEKANNKQTISLAISTQPGNAIVDATAGLFVQKYVAGENITLSANANGEMTINGSNSYELPVATDDTLGGVKAGADISVDGTGEVTVLQANKVKHSLKAGDKNFNGISDIEILASDLGALTSVTAGTGITVSTKSGDSQSISLDLKSNDKYLTLSGNSLASKGIDEAIEAASGSIVTSFIEALNEEILARETGDSYITGTLLSGYSAINTVKAAEQALDLRLDAVEAQLGLGGGNNGNSSVTERLVEVEKTISAYTSTNTISSAIGSISGNVGSLLPLLGLEIQQAEATAGYAATYRLADKSGKQYGSVINIPKDQFLSGAEYDAEAKALKLTFALNGIDSQGFSTVKENVATIPVGDLIDTYTAGNGITLENNQFSLVKDTNADSKFLQIGTNTIGLSGVTDAIEYAVRTKAELADYTADGTAGAGTIQYAIRQNTAAIATLNSDKDTVGSVDYKIDQYDQAISTLVTNINTLKNEII